MYWLEVFLMVMSLLGSFTEAYTAWIDEETLPWPRVAHAVNYCLMVAIFAYFAQRLFLPACESVTRPIFL